MVFGNGGPWSTSTPASVARKNLTSVISGPGSDLAGLNKAEYSLMKCTQTGSGLIVNHLYLVAADFNSLIDIAGIPAHGHTGVGDGGSLVDLIQANPRYCDLVLSQTTDLVKASWNQTVVSGGTIEDIIDGTTSERSIRLRPNTTLGAAATISYPHLRIDFSKRSIFQTKVRIETISSLATHDGVNCDLVTDVDSNTVKYNAEVCTTVNNNWFLRTASGTARSSSDTGIAMTVNRTAIRIELYPDLSPAEADMYIDTSGNVPGTSGIALQKTSDIPIAGQSGQNLIRHSIKNATGADRPIQIYPTRLSYYIADNWI